MGYITLHKTNPYPTVHEEGSSENHRLQKCPALVGDMWSFPRSDPFQGGYIILYIFWKILKGGVDQLLLGFPVPPHVVGDIDCVGIPWFPQIQGVIHIGALTTWFPEFRIIVGDSHQPKYERGVKCTTFFEDFDFSGGVVRELRTNFGGVWL